MRYDSIFFYTKNGERPKRHKMSVVRNTSFILEVIPSPINSKVTITPTPKESATVAIDWGDGTKTEVTSVTFLEHLYAEQKRYVINITGDLATIKFTSQNTTKILSWGDMEFEGDLSYMFFMSDTLEYIAPSNSKTFKNVTSLSSSFQQFPPTPCILPSKFFYGLENCTDFHWLFYSSNLIFENSIFENCTAKNLNFEGICKYGKFVNQRANRMFKNCKAETINFENAFYFCEKMIEIGNEIFKGCEGDISFARTFQSNNVLEKVGDEIFAELKGKALFEYTFYYDKCLRNIGDGMFKNSTAELTFDSTFYLCEALESLPQDMFSGVHNIISIRDMFYYCGAIKSIPTNFIGENLKLTRVENMFAYCSSLTHVADDIFDNCPNLQSLVGCFSGCTSLISAPKLWEKFPNADGRFCYGNCTSLPWYDEIPSNWK